MGVIGIYDADFFTYQKILPNLECAKLCAYYKKNKEIAVLTPTLAPERFSSIFIRKDYDDGIYPSEYFQEGISLGGKVFSPGKYVPMKKEIEKVVPDFSVYSSYGTYFGSTKPYRELLKKIIGCANLRLATDGRNIDSWIKKEDYLFQGTRGIIFHDYNLNEVEGSFDFVKKWVYSRKTLAKETPYPYPIGTKFPIQVYDEESFLNWASLPLMPHLFCLQYNGLMSDDLCNKLYRIGREKYCQFLYQIDYGCSSENDFLMNRIPKLLHQFIFLRRIGVKIPLTYDDNFITTPQLKDFIQILNGFMTSSGECLPINAIIKYCRWLVNEGQNIVYRNIFRRNVILPTERVRGAVQYIREKNYEAFKMLYEVSHVSYNGRELIDDSAGN